MPILSLLEIGFRGVHFELETPCRAGGDEAAK